MPAAPGSSTNWPGAIRPLVTCSLRSGLVAGPAAEPAQQLSNSEVTPLSLSMTKLDWYLNRLQAMSAAEVRWRLEDEAKKWPGYPSRSPLALLRRSPTRRALVAGADLAAAEAHRLRFVATLRPQRARNVPPTARRRSLRPPTSHGRALGAAGRRSPRTWRTLTGSSTR